MAPTMVAVVDAAVAAQKKAAKSYTKEEWLEHKPLIEDLYQLKRRSTAHVEQALRERNFHVNERMIKTRIREWRLDKKHKFVDMRTAVALMAECRSKWARQPPRFFIRGQIVTYTEVQQYFRRKRIPDPFDWLDKLPEDGFVASPDVKLLTTTVDTEDEAPVEPFNFNDTPAENSTAPLPTTTVENSSAIARWDPAVLRRKALEKAPQGVSIIHPYQHLPGDRVIWVTRDYIASYLESPRANFHKEPQLHRWTVHADFAQRMHTGMFVSSKGDMIKAFQHWDMAFEMLRKLFSNDHPMSIATLMSVVCELQKHNLRDIIAQLISLARKIAEVQRGASHQLTSMFDVLENADADAAELAISSMKISLDHLRRHAGPLHWKTLYVKERLCDALYYLGRSDEGAMLRSSLLDEQEQAYDRHARNVLWTLTNVADDDLQRGDLPSAETRFKDALERANVLEGYESEMGRFKAFVGLAKTAAAHGDALSQHDSTLRRRKMREALSFYEKAEKEASTSSWFDGQRRTSVTESRAALKLRLDNERPDRTASNSSVFSVED